MMANPSGASHSGLVKQHTQTWSPLIFITLPLHVFKLFITLPELTAIFPFREIILSFL